MAKKKSEFVETEEMVNYRNITRYSSNNESITSDVKTMTSKLDIFRNKLLNVK